MKIFMLGNTINVSIHVPLAEHDAVRLDKGGKGFVSIHVPLAEHDAKPRPTFTGSSGFNSRAPRGARPLPPETLCPSHTVSIHVPLAEHDLGALQP